MKKIFVIEDNDLNYLLLEEILSDYDVLLIRACNGKDFYSQISQPVNFDLILMDMMLPDTNGIILTKFLIQNNFNIPIIFISASIDRREEVYDLGIKCFIEKPIMVELFLNNLRQNLELEKVKHYN